MKRSIRSSRSEISFKVDVLKNFANFIGKHLCWSLFVILLKRESVTGVFLRNLQNLYICNTLFHRTPPVAASVVSIFKRFPKHFQKSYWKGTFYTFLSRNSMLEYWIAAFSVRKIHNPVVKPELFKRFSLANRR